MGLLRRWIPLIAVAVMLAGAGVAASMTQLPLSQSFSTPVESQVPRDDPETERPVFKSPVPKEASEDAGMPAWVSAALIALVSIVVLVLAVMAQRSVSLGGRKFRRRSLRRRDRAEDEPAATLDEEVVAAIEAGLLELYEEGTDPRRAVIACWVRLERAAAAAGTPRQKGDTPTDLVMRLLAGHSLSEDMLTDFADVYRRARYASHDVNETMREQARAALARLHGQLTKPAGTEQAGL